MRSKPINCGTSLSCVHMTPYKANSWLFSTRNGVLPNRRQYKVTPNAQTSIAFVIGGRWDGGGGDDEAWSVDAELESLPPPARASEEESGGISVPKSYTTSGARKDG